MSKTKKFFTPKRLAVMALLIALQVVLARFVGLQISEGLRISFEVVPVFLAGLWLGPVAGGLVGLISDILGTVISGYGVYFAPLSITPVLNGVLPWLIFKFVWKDDINVAKCAATLVFTEIISSLLCGTYALTWYYQLFVPSKTVTFGLLLVTRLTKFLTIAADAIIVTTLHMSLYEKTIKPILAERR